MTDSNDPSPPPTPNPRPWRLPILLATWFGSGWLPVAPGTWGSLAALPCAWIIVQAGGVPALAAATVLVTAVGWWAAEAYVRELGGDDPGPVVIDEVAGQWLTLLVVAAPDPLRYGIGFALFRLADIVKPWPASWADKRLHGGLGIMLDDVFAGVYAAAALWAIDRYLLGGL
ncbi:MAG: phosphatidylglycerophosphatase A [Rhodospirillaceae bacterium]